MLQKCDLQLSDTFAMSEEITLSLSLSDSVSVFKLRLFFDRQLSRAKCAKQIIS